MSFNIKRVNRESFHVLSVSGYMGNDECRKLETELDHLHQQGHVHIIIDFAALTFITSASLFRLSKQARQFQRAKGELKLADLPLLAARLMKAGRLERVLRPVVGLATAVKLLSIPEPPAPKQKCFQSGKEFLRASNNTQGFAVEPS